jgi:hypothetical protein
LILNGLAAAKGEELQGEDGWGSGLDFLGTRGMIAQEYSPVKGTKWRAR